MGRFSLASFSFGVFRVSNPYRYPEVGHVYRECLVCGRPFRVVRSRQMSRGIFCTRTCCKYAWRAFSAALRDERFRLILRGLPGELARQQ
jgi:hypothetical protein